MENPYLKTKKIYGGLLPTPKENQTFSFGAVFGYISPLLLPEEYRVGTPLEIKNQNIPSPTWICVAESLCSVREYQEGIALEPAFTIKVISEILGNTNWISGGTSLEVGAKASLRGFLSRSEAPYSVEKDTVGIVALPDTWAKTYDEIALKHATKDWFWIGTSGGSMFDKIRSALYTFKDEHRAIQTGCMWNLGWEDLTYIEKETQETGGHAIAIIGWVGDWLIIQNSIGNVGENGLQYIHKDLVNKLFTFGCLMFQDMPDGLSKEEILKKSKYYRASFWRKVVLKLLEYFKNIMQ